MGECLKNRRLFIASAGKLPPITILRKLVYIAEGYTSLVESPLSENLRVVNDFSGSLEQEYINRSDMFLHYHATSYLIATVSVSYIMPLIGAGTIEYLKIGGEEQPTTLIINHGNGLKSHYLIPKKAYLMDSNGNYYTLVQGGIILEGSMLRVVQPAIGFETQALSIYIAIEYLEAFVDPRPLLAQTYFIPELFYSQYSQFTNVKGAKPYMNVPLDFIYNRGLVAPSDLTPFDSENSTYLHTLNLPVKIMQSWFASIPPGKHLTASITVNAQFVSGVGWVCGNINFGYDVGYEFILSLSTFAGDPIPPIIVDGPTRTYTIADMTGLDIQIGVFRTNTFAADIRGGTPISISTPVNFFNNAFVKEWNES